MSQEKGLSTKVTPIR